MIDLKAQTFTSHNGDYRHVLYCPVKNPKSIIILIHGFGEHIERYEPFFSNFNSHQISCIGFDQQGHGRTVKSSQGQGKLGHGDMDTLLADLKDFIQQVQTLMPELPIILVGHSMGGNLVLHYALSTMDSPVKAMVVCSPFLDASRNIHPIEYHSAYFFARFLPSLRVSAGIDSSSISRDPDVVKDYVSDPLNSSKISLQMVTSLFDSCQWIENCKLNIDIPYKIFYGANDLIASVEATDRFVAKHQCEHQKYPGYVHELMRDIDKELVINDIIQWVEQHISTTNA